MSPDTEHALCVELPSLVGIPLRWAVATANLNRFCELSASGNLRVFATSSPNVRAGGQRLSANVNRVEVATTAVILLMLGFERECALKEDAIIRDARPPECHHKSDVLVRWFAIT